jgi:hypothetical protein
MTLSNQHSSAYFRAYLDSFYPAALRSGLALTTLATLLAGIFTSPAVARPLDFIPLRPPAPTQEPPLPRPGMLPNSVSAPVAAPVRPQGNVPPNALPNAQWNSSAPIPDTVPAGLLPVPTQPIPLGNQGGNRSLVPPPIPTALAGPRYRVVVVQAMDPDRRAQLRALVPDAFRSSYQGQPVIQVGSFPERDKAEAVFQLVQSSGFQAVIQEVP